MQTPAEPPYALNGSRIFIVEDEALVAMMIEAMIEEFGGVVVATHRHVDAALEFLASQHGEVDAAVLDINLGGARSYDIAHALGTHGIPFLFSSGYDDGSIPPEWRHLPRVRKPFQLNELGAALVQALESARPKEEEPD